ncbi:unnamed protein product [Amoebophrya sp. A120]|nr:unnamed protein product [Amoebophrya sp. A120]|eukprot:GSA120T00015930001.1
MLAYPKEPGKRIVTQHVLAAENGLYGGNGSGPVPVDHRGLLVLGDDIQNTRGSLNEQPPHLQNGLGLENPRSPRGSGSSPRNNGASQTSTGTENVQHYFASEPGMMQHNGSGTSRSSVVNSTVRIKGFSSRNRPEGAAASPPAAGVPSKNSEIIPIIDSQRFADRSGGVVLGGTTVLQKNLSDRMAEFSPRANNGNNSKNSSNGSSSHHSYNHILSGSRTNHANNIACTYGGHATASGAVQGNNNFYPHGKVNPNVMPNANAAQLRKQNYRGRGVAGCLGVQWPGHSPTDEDLIGDEKELHEINFTGMRRKTLDQIDKSGTYGRSNAKSADGMYNSNGELVPVSPVKREKQGKMQGSDVLNYKVVLQNSGQEPGAGGGDVDQSSQLQFQTNHQDIHGKWDSTCMEGQWPEVETNQDVLNQRGYRPGEIVIGKPAPQFMRGKEQEDHRAYSGGSITQQGTQKMPEATLYRELFKARDTSSLNLVGTFK